MSGGDEGEFEFIARRLAPLAAGFPGAAGLKDDGAVLAPLAGRDFVVTADTLVEGRHFPVGEDPALAARKALRVNLSDLAAMGADPLCYFLNIVWPESGFRERMDAFADGLAADQAQYGIALAGGDTTRAAGPWTIAVTMIGTLPSGETVRRSGAQAGDLLVVTGAIGDAWLGLQCRLRHFDPFAPAYAADVERRFTLPEPRVSPSSAVRRHARAAIDISDGLLADSRHLAHASGLALLVDLERMPLSQAASAWLASHPNPEEGRLALASGGDDYELALAVDEAELAAFEAAALAAGAPATVIGRFDAGEPSLRVSCGERIVSPARFGFTHF